MATRPTPDDKDSPTYQPIGSRSRGPADKPASPRTRDVEKEETYERQRALRLEREAVRVRRFRLAESLRSTPGRGGESAPPGGKGGGLAPLLVTILMAVARGLLRPSRKREEAER